MKPRRGDTREDGKVYWGVSPNHKSGEYWVSKEQFDNLKALKRERYRRKSEALNSKKINISRGFEREDGMVFWGYHADCKDGEKWISKIEYQTRLEQIQEKLALAKAGGIRKRGDTREDGFVFWCYSHGSANGEQWVTKDEFRRLKMKQLAISIKYRRRNPQAARDKTRRWREKNPDAGAKYFQNNKEKIYARRNERMLKDPLFACRMKIHNNIKGVFHRFPYSKKSKCAEILGCSFEEFKAHLESQFLPGMSWDSKKEWHIDHIMPVSMAATYDEIIRLNHYKNLRPMWAKDNLRKSNKTPETLVLF